MMTAVPMVLVREVYEIAEQEPELSYAKVAERAGTTANKAYRWLTQPERFSPWIDETAIQRALDGDRAVFKNLSVYELTEFWYRTIGRIKATETQTKNHENAKGGYEYNPYTQYLIDCLGIKYDNMIKRQAVALEYRPLHREGLDED